jgi:hypothetical protein
MEQLAARNCGGWRARRERRRRHQRGYGEKWRKENEGIERGHWKDGCAFGRALKDAVSS